MALLSGIALSPELQDRYGWRSKNCDPVSVLRVRPSRLFGQPSLSRSPRVRSACTVLLHPSFAGTLSAPSAGTLLPLTIAGTSTGEWLSSLGNSLRPPPAPAIYSTVANLALGFAVSWYSTTSLAHAKVRSVADFPGSQPVTNALPHSRSGRGRSVRHPAIVVLSSLSVGTRCRKNPFFCFGEPAEGFVYFPGFFSILVFPYVSGGRYCSVLLSS